MNTASSKIRTVALVGHGAAGKTTLAESLLAASGAISSRGSVERGNTLLDFDPLEREFGHSLQAAMASFQWGGAQVHLIDTPGYPDFMGQAIGALAAVDCALLVVNAQTGIELATERMFNLAGDRGLCRMIVINKIDADNVDLPALVANVRERFGKQCLLLDLPVHHGQEVVELLGHDSGESDFASIAAAHRALIDQIVEEDEDLMARYLEDGTDPSPEALHEPFERALRAGHLIPILFVSARTGAGIPQLLDAIAKLAPRSWQIKQAQGQVARALKKDGQARTVLEQAVALAPTEPAVVNDYAVLLLELDEPAKAKDVLSRALGAHPDDAGLHLNLALAYGKLKDVLKAKVHAEHAKTSGDADVREQAARLLAQLSPQ